MVDIGPSSLMGSLAEIRGEAGTFCSFNMRTHQSDLFTAQLSFLSNCSFRSRLCTPLESAPFFSQKKSDSRVENDRKYTQFREIVNIPLRPTRSSHSLGYCEAAKFSSGKDEEVLLTYKCHLALTQLTSKFTPDLDSLTPLQGMTVKRVDRNLIIFEDKTIDNHINEKALSRDLH